jgi:hypothetical protein
MVGDVPVLVRVRMRTAKDDGVGVNMEVRVCECAREIWCVTVVVQVTVRSSNAEISKALSLAIG